MAFDRPRLKSVWDSASLNEVSSLFQINWRRMAPSFIGTGLGWSVGDELIKVPGSGNDEMFKWCDENVEIKKFPDCISPSLMMDLNLEKFYAS